MEDRAPTDEDLRTGDGVRCMVLRGGSSKGAYFLRDDLPDDADERDRLLRRVMGSPDPRQIDGIGGAHPLTSKVAVVSASNDTRPGTDNGDDTADIDYLFLQIGVDDEVVSDRQNCGNLLAGVGPFAVERGLIQAPTHGETTVRIRMCNTGSIATARFAVSDGMPVYAGDTAISGVPGHAAPIHLDFDGLAGGSTGALLPTGNVVDLIDGVPCTLVDNGMPVVVLAAAAVGINGDEPCDVLEANDELRNTIEAIRLQAGHLMNLGEVSATTVPKITMVSPPTAGGHLATRTFIPHRCHEAIGVLGAVSVATAALLDGSPASECLATPDGDTVRLEHPTGFFDAVVTVVAGSPGTQGTQGTEGTQGVVVERAGIIRTARKLMDGVVFP